MPPFEKANRILQDLNCTRLGKWRTTGGSNDENIACILQGGGVKVAFLWSDRMDIYSLDCDFPLGEVAAPDPSNRLEGNLFGLRKFLRKRVGKLEQELSEVRELLTAIETNN